MQFKTIASYYDDSISYESKKKKIKILIEELGSKLDKITKTNGTLLIQKNPNDKRQSQVSLR